MENQQNDDQHDDVQLRESVLGMAEAICEYVDDCQYGFDVIFNGISVALSAFMVDYAQQYDATLDEVQAHFNDGLTNAIAAANETYAEFVADVLAKEAKAA
jgi:hypothetical protein